MGKTGKVVSRPAYRRMQTADSWRNLMLRAGIGAGSADDGGHYAVNYTSRDRAQLDAAFRSNWMAMKMVSLPAIDMTREGVELGGALTPDQISALNKCMQRRAIWKLLRDAIKWGRLYGGAIAVIDIKGHDPEWALTPEMVSRGTFRGLMVFDRWQAMPDGGDLITRPGRDFGLPCTYLVRPQNHNSQGFRVHHSRVIRFEGDALPMYQRAGENYWGQSVLESAWDRLMSFDSATIGAGQLIKKAHLRVAKVKGLRQIVAQGGDALDAVANQFRAIRMLQNSEGLTVLDADDDMQFHSYAFSGLSDLIIQFGQQLSGASNIPMVRLFGQSPVGMNATGESDLRNYYDYIAGEQESALREPLELLLDIMCRSELGMAVPGATLDFAPLWQLSGEERATTGGAITDTIIRAHEAGLIQPQTALREMQQLGEPLGMWTNISEEDFATATVPMPPAPEGFAQPGAPDEPKPV